MNDIQKRFILFLLLCIPARFLLVFLAKKANIFYLKVMGFILLIPAIGFLYLFITKTRQTAGEVFGDKVWWHNLRLIHGLNFLLFGVLAIYGFKKAWIILLIDVIFGLISFFIYHYTNKNFNKLLIDYKIV